VIKLRFTTLRYILNLLKKALKEAEWNYLKIIVKGDQLTT